MHINNLPVRWVGQRHGANYAEPFPGEHVEHYLSLDHAREQLKDDQLGCVGDTIVLWKADPHDSRAEADSRTLSDIAEADRIITLGPRGGTTTQRL